ncbi:MAG TPA: hypothetical protein VK054_05865, partial [Beutenbergiaceae bacterium]|nr:hypothetical protein [Beutenbergiaceae bacterium]
KPTCIKKRACQLVAAGVLRLGRLDGARQTVFDWNSPAVRHCSTDRGYGGGEPATAALLPVRDALLRFMKKDTAQ